MSSDIDSVLAGGKVISFEAARKRRGCGGTHQRFVIDEDHGTVCCAECDEPVDPFHAMCVLAQYESTYRNAIAAMREEIERLKNYEPRRTVIRELDRTWRKKQMLPCCPHCGRGVEAEDLARATINKEFEQFKLQKEAKQRNEAGS